MTQLLERLATARKEGWDGWIRSEADERAVRDGCRFDAEAAERVRKFFLKFLRHSKGQWAGEPFGLLDWQWEQVVAPLFGWKRSDGTRRFRRGYVEVPKKNGKALALDTPLPTPSGWTVMGDVQVGDMLLDENGLPCTVVAATDVLLDRPCFELTFSDGTSVIADGEHEWLTTTEQGTALRTTFEIAGSLDAASASFHAG